MKKLARIRLFRSGFFHDSLLLDSVLPFGSSTASLPYMIGREIGALPLSTFGLKSGMYKLTVEIQDSSAEVFYYA